MIGTSETLFCLLEEGLSHLEILLLISLGDVVLDLSRILSEGFQAKDFLLLIIQIRLLLELEDLLEQELTGDTSFLGIVTEVTKSILDSRGILNHG